MQNVNSRLIHGLDSFQPNLVGSGPVQPKKNLLMLVLYEDLIPYDNNTKDFYISFVYAFYKVTTVYTHTHTLFMAGAQCRLQRKRTVVVDCNIVGD